MAECRYYGKCAKACDGHGLCTSFRNVTYGCEDFEPMPDVKALKGLADEMEYDADAENAAKYDPMLGSIARMQVKYANRIREALGEGA